MKSSRVVTISTGVLALCAWIYFLHSQNAALERAAATQTSAAASLRGGKLSRASEQIASAESQLSKLRVQFLVWPKYRQLEISLTSAVELTKLEYQEYLHDLETAAQKLVAELRASPSQARANFSGLIPKTIMENMSVGTLQRFLERLEMQDFKEAEVSAKQALDSLSSEPISPTTKAALQEFVDTVGRERAKNIDVHASIAGKVHNLISQSSTLKSESFRPKLKGKALIWDETRKEVEMAYELLPDNLRAASTDRSVTIFSIVRREQILRGHYSTSGQPAYQERMTIGVVYWPEKKSAGTAIVMGGKPRESRPVSQSPEYGSSVNISDWIKSLPTE
jgi:hypothetical protein